MKRMTLKDELGWSRSEIKLLITGLDMLRKEGQDVCEVKLDFLKQELTVDGEVYSWRWK